MNTAPGQFNRIKAALDVLGVGDPLRKAKRFAHASGLLPWKPLVPEEAFYECIVRVIRAVRDADQGQPFGDYFEFGVSRGTSLSLVYRALRQEGLATTRLIGFDSFEGMPENSEEEGWPEGAYRSTLPATRRFLMRRGVDMQRVTLVQGWFVDTLNQQTRDTHKLGKASLITIDCDIYSASKDALAFCEPHIGDCAALVFDDWGWTERRGEVGQKEAFAEFLAEHPSLTASPLPSYREEARVFLIRRSGQ